MSDPDQPDLPADPSTGAAPPPPPPPPPPGQTVYVQQQGNGLAVAAMVLGIIGLVLCWIPVIGWVLGILAIIFGVIGRNRANRDPSVGKGGQATAGLVCGIIAVVLATVIFVVALSAVDSVSNALDCIGEANTQAELDAC